MASISGENTNENLVDLTSHRAEKGLSFGPGFFPSPPEKPALYDQETGESKEEGTHLSRNIGILALAGTLALVGALGKDEIGKRLAAMQAVGEKNRTHMIDIQKENGTEYTIPSLEEDHRLLIVGKTYMDGEGEEHRIGNIESAAAYAHAMNPDVSEDEALDYYYAANTQRQRELGIAEPEIKPGLVHPSDNLITPVIFGAGELKEPKKENSVD